MLILREAVERASEHKGPLSGGPAQEALKGRDSKSRARRVPAGKQVYNQGEFITKVGISPVAASSNVDSDAGGIPKSCLDI